MTRLLQTIRLVHSRLSRHGWRLGAAVLLVAGVGASAARAQPLEPEAPVPEAAQGGGGGIQGVVIHACPDTFETDDFLANAKALVAGVDQAHTFDGNLNLGVSDQDWVSFDVAVDGVYTLTTSSLSALTDTFIKLYDAKGDPVMNGSIPVENDDSGAPDFGSRIVWTAKTAGTYYLLVENKTQNATAYEDCAGTQVRYTLSLARQLPTVKALYLPLVVKGP